MHVDCTVTVKQTTMQARRASFTVTATATAFPRLPSITPSLMLNLKSIASLVDKGGINQTKIWARQSM